MPDSFISDAQLAARYGVSRNTVWRWTREQEGFPQPLKLTPGCTRWRMSDVERWETSRAEAVS